MCHNIIFLLSTPSNTKMKKEIIFKFKNPPTVEQIKKFEKELSKGEVDILLPKENLFDYYKRWNTKTKIMFWGLIASIGFVLMCVSDLLVKLIK